MKTFIYESFFGHGNDPCYGMDDRPDWTYFPPSTILEILQNEAIPASDRIWAFTQPLSGVDDRTLRLFACKCVRDTHLPDGRKVWDLLTDEHSRNAVIVAERFANGEATEEDLIAARDAARDAAWVAAWVAIEAARDAAEAARDAVWVAAWDAVWVAAWDAQVEFAIELLKA